MGSTSVKHFKSLQTSEILEKVNPVVIIAHNLRTPENIGMIMRLAANIGAKLTLFAFDHEVEFRESKIKRTSSGAIEKINWKKINTHEIGKYLPEGYEIVALETSENSKNLFSFEFPEKTAFLVGSEILGLNKELLSMSNHEVYIPVPGNIYSLNVTHALSVGLFCWFKNATLNFDSP